MYENLSHKDVKARKKHTCDYCGEAINAGELHYWEKFIYDGDFYEWRCHLRCIRVASAIWDYVDPDEGMSDGEFQEGCADICRQFVCPDCPHWNKEYDDCDKDESYCLDRLDEFFKTHELYKAGRKAYYVVWKCREKEKQNGNQDV